MSRRVKKKKVGKVEKKEEIDLYDKNVYDHLKPENRAKQKVLQQKNSSSNTILIVSIVIIAILSLGLIGGYFSNDIGSNNNNNNNNNNNPTVSNNIQYQPASQVCMQNENNLVKHIHYFLKIYIDGSFQIVPANIGVESNCLRPVHTHSADGKVHEELPNNVNPDVTLGVFFEIWGQPLSQTKLLSYTGNLTMEISNQGQSYFLDRSPSSYIPLDGDTIYLRMTTQ